jgi:hypothetical protein
MKKIVFVLVAALLFGTITTAHAKENFGIEAFSPNQFYVFVKVFGEMRGPLRSEILKDRKTNFENADPLKYVEKVKGTRDVKKSLKDNDLQWEEFMGLMGNILLSYFSIQPDKTKSAMLKQLASYDLFLASDQIPPEYRELVTEVVKTDAGAALADMALETFMQIPEGNIEIVKKNKKDLDRMFYTKYWIDELK